MRRPLPKNLEDLYRILPPDRAANMYGGHSFVLDGVEFVSGYSPESTSERFFIVKSEELIAMYREFLDEHRPARVFELGIAEGGSVALLALMPFVERVVAIDNEKHRLPALDEFIAARGLEDAVRAHYAVDQSDRDALLAIVDHDFDGGEIDLVIDDASHVYDLTVASFEVLFPRLSRGGWYLIEDWAQALKLATALAPAATDGISSPAPGPEPLTRIGLELAIATCVASGTIDGLVMNHEFIAVRRGPEPLDAPSFRLRDLTGGAIDQFLAPRQLAPAVRDRGADGRFSSS